MAEIDAAAETATANADEKTKVGGPLGAFLGFLVLAAVNAILIEVIVPLPWRLSARLLHHVYDLGQFVALGLFSAALVMLFAKVRPRVLRSGSARWGVVVDAVALSVPALAVGFSILPFELTNFAALKSSQFGISASILKPFFTAAVSLGIPAGALVGVLIGKDKTMRWIAVSGAVSCAIANDRSMRHDYESAHFFLGLLAAALAGGALASAARPPWFVAMGAWTWRGLVGLAGVLAAFAVLVRPSPGVLHQLLALQGSFLEPFLAARAPDEGRGAASAVVPVALEPWIATRAGRLSVAPTPPVASPRRTIVLLLTIDSLRAELVDSGEWDSMFPTLAALRDASVHFTNAKSPGAQTVYTLPSLFTGKYFSELEWVRQSNGIWFPKILPPDSYFPKLIGRRGVPTVYYKAGAWLDASHGVTGGFDKEIELPQKHGYNEYANAKVGGDRVVARLEQVGQGSLFLFMHFLDAHLPYGRAGGRGEPWDAYLEDVTFVDHELARIREAVDRLGLADRTTIIVSADHGEAFGEHDTHAHGVSVYDELTHVPLLVVGPYAPHQVDALVSLMDLGPTILDVFGVATPIEMTGESLVPVLRGAEPHFTRPVFSEDRLKQAMWFDDGVKVIRDLRRGEDELYDLHRDPGELVDRVDDPEMHAAARLGLVGAFFGARAFRREGYVTPLRR